MTWLELRVVDNVDSDEDETRRIFIHVSVCAGFCLDKLKIRKKFQHLTNAAGVAKASLFA